MKLARLLHAAQAIVSLGCAFTPAREPAESRAPSALRIRAPDFARPLTDTLPDPGSRPEGAVKEGIFARINRDRVLAGLVPVAWDEAASRVADAFCAQQVREASRGHFLMDGLPPYARTAFAGVFGAQSENSVSWVTSAPSFTETPLQLALVGHKEMMDELPPDDGDPRTILDPDATHVGIGYASAHGRFQMSQEFLTRSIERLSVIRRDASRVILRFEGKPVTGSRLSFVTIAREAPPAPLTREEASARTSYSYPKPSLAYVPEGNTAMRVAGVDTRDKLHVWSNTEFYFTFAPDQPGLYTFAFYTSVRPSQPSRAGASVTVWIEGLRD
jgi:uncharacterized protein YkwD